MIQFVCQHIGTINKKTGLLILLLSVTIITFFFINEGNHASKLYFSFKLFQKDMIYGRSNASVNVRFALQNSTNSVTSPKPTVLKINLSHGDVRVIHQPSRGRRYYSPNLNFLTQNRNKIVLALGHLGGSFKANDLEKLVKTTMPSVWTDTSAIKAHTPSGKPLDMETIHRSIYDPNNIVPRASHFVLPFFNPQLQFHHAVCIMSGYWIAKPKKLFLWYNEVPTGHWWNYLRKNITDWESNVIMVHRVPPNMIYDRPLNLKEHKSDIIRMEALILFGGAYFDLDVITLKSLEALKNYSFTIGRERPDGLCNGVMIACPNSTFMLLHHLSYQVS